MQCTVRIVGEISNDVFFIATFNDRDYQFYVSREAIDDHEGYSSNSGYQINRAAVAERIQGKLIEIAKKFIDAGITYEPILINTKTLNGG